MSIVLNVTSGSGNRTWVRDALVSRWLVGAPFQGATRLDLVGGGTPALVQRPRVVAYFTDWAGPQATQHHAHESLQSTLRQ